MPDFDFFHTFEKSLSQQATQKFNLREKPVGFPQSTPKLETRSDSEISIEEKLKIFEDTEKLELQQQELLANVQKYKETRDQQAFDVLMKYLEPTIEQGIRVFGQGNESLRGQTKLLVINAIDSYDPQKGDLKTYVLLHLQRLRRLSGQANPVNVPESIKLVLIQIQQAEAELRDKYGRPPSDQEIADYTGLSLKKIQKAREYSTGIAESTVEGVGAVTEKQLTQEQERRELWIQAIYIDLSPVEQYILDSAYGRNGKEKKTLQEIADDLKLPVSTVHAKLKKIEELISLGEQL